MEENATPVEKVIIKRNRKVNRPLGSGETYIIEDIAGKSDGPHSPSKDKKGTYSFYFKSSIYLFFQSNDCRLWF